MACIRALVLVSLFLGGCAKAPVLQDAVPVETATVEEAPAWSVTQYIADWYAENPQPKEEGPSTTPPAPPVYTRPVKTSIGASLTLFLFSAMGLLFFGVWVGSPRKKKKRRR